MEATLDERVGSDEGVDTKEISIFGNPVKSPCAYCKRHNGALTVNQMNAKNCLAKGCRHLVKYEYHEIWKIKAAKKEQRKARKQNMGLWVY